MGCHVECWAFNSCLAISVRGGSSIKRKKGAPFEIKRLCILIFINKCIHVLCQTEDFLSVLQKVTGCIHADNTLQVQVAVIVGVGGVWKCAATHCLTSVRLGSPAMVLGGREFRSIFIRSFTMVLIIWLDLQYAGNVRLSAFYACV